MVVMAIIALLLIYSMANLRTLEHLRGELKLLEQRQSNRVQVAVPQSQQPGTKEPPEPDSHAMAGEANATTKVEGDAKSSIKPRATD